LGCEVRRFTPDIEKKNLLLLVASTSQGFIIHRPFPLISNTLYSFFQIQAKTEFKYFIGGTQVFHSLEDAGKSRTVEFCFITKYINVILFTKETDLAVFFSPSQDAVSDFGVSLVMHIVSFYFSFIEDFCCCRFSIIQYYFGETRPKNDIMF
jgi:hypothetical protein